MKNIIMPLFIFIVFSNILLTNSKNLTPLSECSKGRIFKSLGWENGGLCGFGSHNNATSSSYIYPVAPNSDLFISSSHCGICYELVGPYGVIRVRVEDYCKKDDELGLCSGDMYHFNLANNGSKFLIGDEDFANITFRMVDCGYSGNIKILLDEGSDEYYLSFVILDHNLGVSSVSIQEYESTTWTELKRDEYNSWEYESNDFEIYFPLKIKIFSINGDYVTLEVNEINDIGLYEADGNFHIVNDTFFNLTTLEKEEIPNGSKNCCELDKTDFTPIYKNGQVNYYYNHIEQKVTVNYNSSEIYEDKNTMNVKFQSFGKLSFVSNFPIRADQFSGVSLTIKTSNNCSNCLNIRAYDLENKNKIINLDTINNWKIYRFNFEKLEIENNEFNGIVLYYNKYSTQPFEIYIGSIEIIGKRNVPDAGICFQIPNSDSGEGTIIPPIPEDTDISTSNNQTNITSNETDIQTENITDIDTSNDTEIINYTSTDIESSIYNYNETDIVSSIYNYTESDNNTEDISDNIDDNFTNLININILSIQTNEALPLFIKLNCDPFNNINDIVLLFMSKDKSKTVQTESCILKEEVITSFSCKLPNNIEDGTYNIISPSNKKYAINYSKDIYINNGNIIIDYGENIIDSTEIQIEIETDIKTNDENYTSIPQIKIISDIDKIINKGESLVVAIYPIEKNNFYLKNNEIIFTDSTNSNYLYARECQALIYNDFARSIRCILSNNIMKGVYTTIADGQNLSILDGHYIKLISNNSTGGVFSDEIFTIYDKAEIEELDNLTFNIIYYNPSIKPNTIFPHSVELSGKRRTNIRILEENENKYTIRFPRCFTGNYNSEGSIGSINCKLPNYIPAGTYNQLQSDGFDINPNSKINIIFRNDYNRNSNSTLNGDEINDRDIGIDGYDKEDKDKDEEKNSSSSKTWIVWVIAVILLVILFGIVICACLANRKKNNYDDNNNTYNQENSKSNIQDNSKS